MLLNQTTLSYNAFKSFMARKNSSYVSESTSKDTKEQLSSVISSEKNVDTVSCSSELDDCPILHEILLKTE